MIIKFLSYLKRITRKILYRGLTKNFYRKASAIKVFFKQNLSDKDFIKKHFIENTGIVPNIKDPTHYHEKVLWLKTYYRNPLMKKVSDKYRVRDYVKANGYGDLLPPIYGAYENFSDIDFDDVPNKVFIKSNHTSGHNMMIERNVTSLKRAEKFFNKSKKVNYYTRSREWNYDGIPPLLIVEPYLNMDDFKDYKFFVFNGSVELLQVLDGINDEKGIQTPDYKANIYNKDLELLNRIDKFRDELDYENVKFTSQLKYIWQAAEELGREFPFCRVDFVVSDNKCYFGEITFFPDGGNMVIDDDELSLYLGAKINLEKIPKKHLNI